MPSIDDDGALAGAVPEAKLMLRVADIVDSPLVSQLVAGIAPRTRARPQAKRGPWGADQAHPEPRGRCDLRRAPQFVFRDDSTSTAPVSVARGCYKSKTLRQSTLTRPLVTSTMAEERQHQCAACTKEVPISGFSKGQLRKGSARRCITCVSVAPQHDQAATAVDPSAKLLAHELAAKIIGSVDRGGGGVRTALYSLPNMPNKIRPTVTALVSEVMRELPSLLHCVDAVRGPWTSDKAVRYLAAVLVYEIVICKRAVKGGARHEIGRAVFERRDELAAAHPQASDSGTNGDASALPPAAKKPRLPRYVRVNTLLSSVDDVRADLGDALNAKTGADPLVPHLLLLPPKTNLHGHALVESGRIILQDRCSCLPALALAPPPGAVVVDSCAAPGNKTTQLASMVGTGGTVFAFERNARRAQTLRTMVGKAGAADIVRVCEADFTLADGTSGGGGGKQLARATMALCDPSCSGSGGAGGHFNLHGGDGGEDDEYWERVRALAASQVQIVHTAMRLPGVRTVVYSTCSVHREENEDVVASLLEATGGEWQLARCLPSWPTRGLADVPHGKLCVRAGADDGTHGFFVARFEKVQDKASGEARGQGEQDSQPDSQPWLKKKKKKLAAAVGP